jgi:hypothetical protein
LKTTKERIKIYTNLRIKNPFVHPVVSQKFTSMESAAEGSTRFEMVQTKSKHKKPIRAKLFGCQLQYAMVSAAIVGRELKGLVLRP